jgi:lysophospholipase L1-like esterase
VKPEAPQPEKPDSLIQPWYVTVFVACTIAVLATIVYFYPKGGISTGPLAIRMFGLNLPLSDSVKFYFPTWDDFFNPDEDKPELTTILAALAQDPLTDTNATAKGGDTTKQHLTNVIQYPNGDKSILYPAFTALEKSANEGKPTRVIHYGDSQIEGDRMSSLFRTRLQEKFGGCGPGLVAAKPLVSSMTVSQEYSESMIRYTQYGAKDASVKHQRYGAMAIFSRFSPIVADSLYNPGEMKTGWVSLKRGSGASAQAKIFENLKMYYGFNRSDVNVKLFLDDVPVADDNLPARKGLGVKHWHFKSNPNKIMLIMEGADSPDIYGLSLEGDNGVALDNISMRGSSGTTFGSLDYVPFKPMLDSLNPKLIFMQYGGNTVPYIKDKKSADNYGHQFKSQIDYLKKMVPGVCVVVIGPGDMSTKVEGKMQTYPNLVNVRNAIRQAAFDAGAAFFDIYEAMGGHNSMIEWAEAEPSLAAPDYVHFSPKGARIIAEAFIKSFLADYETYARNSIN